MNYITDYQLDINKGFMCRVNGKPFRCEFLTTEVLGKHFYVSNILKVADAMGVPRYEFIGIFNSEHVNHVIYCDSRQQCYDLCQHIVNTYFKPDAFRKNEEEFSVVIDSTVHSFYLTKNIMFYWDSKTIASRRFTSHLSLDKIKAICATLNIDSKHHNFTYGFNTKDDAVKFAKYVIKYYYSIKKEINAEKSRRYLTKYYANDESYVILNNVQWNLIWDQRKNVWWYHSSTNGISEYFTQFGLKTAKEVINLCSCLGISAKYTNKVEFDSRQDAIKFTDYLIETYIIKKETTYENQLRKERTAIRRGAKPAGSIIHGRRSKASIRCGCIKHQTCIGY